MIGDKMSIHVCVHDAITAVTKEETFLKYSGERRGT